MTNVRPHMRSSAGSSGAKTGGARRKQVGTVHRLHDRPAAPTQATILDCARSGLTPWAAGRQVGVKRPSLRRDNGLQGW